MGKLEGAVGCKVRFFGKVEGIVGCRVRFFAKVEGIVGLGFRVQGQYTARPQNLSARRGVYCFGNVFHESYPRSPVEPPL